MKKAFRALALMLLLALTLTSCSLFFKTSSSSGQTPPPNKPTTDLPKDPSDAVASNPTVAELLETLCDYSMADTTLLLAASEDCRLLLPDGDSQSVTNSVLHAVEKKYDVEILPETYTANQLLYGVTDMVEKGSGTHYFADVLILSATEFAAYREADLLLRLETLPFLDLSSECFEADLAALFSDDDGTYGVVGAASHSFKSKITLFFNPELLAAAGIDFNGYEMVANGSFDVDALQAVLWEYSEKTDETAITSGLSTSLTEKLLSQIGSEILVSDCGNDGSLAFMMGKVPFYIGTLGDVEKMPTARDKYGMLPIPYTEDGQYGTFYDTDSLYVFCVPKGNARTDCTGLLLQAWHMASMYLPYDYFTSQLIEKYVWDEGTLKSIFLVEKKAEIILEN